MIGSKDLRTKLEGLRELRGAAAAEKALSGIPFDDELREIEQVDKLLQLPQKTNTKTLYTAFLIGSTCLVVASLLWTVRTPRAHIQLVATSESLAIRLSQDLNWSGNWDLSNGLVRLEDMTRVELPPELSDSNSLAGRAWIEIKNGEVALKQFDVKPKAQLSVANDQLRMITLSSRDASILGQLEVLGKPHVEAGSAPEQSITTIETGFTIPGTITFFHDAASAPGILRATPKDTIELRNLHVGELSFAKENPDSEIPFESGIIDGSVTILSTGEKVSFERGTRLRLDGVAGAISRLTIGPTGINLTYDGTVESAATGPPGFERQLKPSLLDYLYHQQRLGFFWAAASFLWGLLWSARTLIFK